MTDNPLSAEEFRGVARACAKIRLSEPAPGYLREFIVRRLGGAGLADLAGKVSRLGRAEMGALAAGLVRHQEMGRSLFEAAGGEAGQRGQGKGSARGAGNGHP